MDMHWGKDLQTLVNGVHRARIQLPDEDRLASTSS